MGQRVGLGDHLDAARAGRRVLRVLLLEPARDPCGATGTSAAPGRVADYYADVRRAAAAGHLRRPLVHRSGGHGQRRPSLRRHPAGPDVHLAMWSRRSPHRPNYRSRRPGPHLRRVGRVLGPCRPAPAPDDRGTPDDPGGENDFGQARLPHPVDDRVALDCTPWQGGSPRLRAHLRAQVHRRELGPALPHHPARAHPKHRKAFRKFKSFDPEPEFTPYEFAAQTAVAPSAAELRHAPATGDLHRLAESGFLDGLGFNLDQRLEDSFLSPSSVRPLLAIQR